MPRPKVKQTQLTFAPVASSPGFEHSPGDSPDRLARVRYGRSSKSFLHRRPPRIDDYLTRRENLSPVLPPTTGPSAGEERSSSAKLGQSSQISLTDNENSQPRITGASSPCPPSKANPYDTGHASSDEDAILVSTRRQQRNKAGASINDSDLDLDHHVKVKGKRKSLKSKRPKERDGITIERRKAEDVLENNASRKTRSSAQRRSDKNTPIVLSDFGSPETSDAEEIVTRPTRRLRRGVAQKRKAIVEDESDESEEEPIVSPTKRRKRNEDIEEPKTPRQTSEQDRLDLEEDLKDLQDSVVKSTRTRGHLANSARSKRQQQLEALRRRRAGERVKSITELELEPNEKGLETGDSESETGGPQLGYQDATDESDVEPAIPIDEDLDRDDDEFILEDDEAELGVPTEIPFEFTRHAYKQTKEYFRDVVEWMVHNKLNPAFPRADALYEVAFLKVEDEVKGRTGSQLVSTVWNSSFQRALMARPYIQVTPYPIADEHSCDACNRSSHPASFEIKLHGKPYSLETLEPLSDDDSDEEGNETATMDRDRKGNVLPDENTRFLLGRHCKAKATMAHALIHWRVDLNEWVIGYLEHQGILSDNKILERSHWSVKRQTRYANEVVDMMVQSGEVKKLWRDFHITLKEARGATI
ncbi:hypothetical protein MPDQ_001758 [Monascus purpureus]|uniref:DUF4211 domain-containing protein n=1 Tax=Monascus purpureus TaxID=5098 RepID=A0A507R3S1_MONPU|nr:hypothetical protein MPDQ_001758 [Monascus purpureus]BDD59662.1 hypothetical protein MAP00_004857 [Monascus purpureus]